MQQLNNHLGANIRKPLIVHCMFIWWNWVQRRHQRCRRKSDIFIRQSSGIIITWRVFVVRRRLPPSLSARVALSPTPSSPQLYYHMAHAINFLQTVTPQRRRSINNLRKCLSWVDAKRLWINWMTALGYPLLRCSAAASDRRLWKHVAGRIIMGDDDDDDYWNT